MYTSGRLPAPPMVGTLTSWSPLFKLGALSVPASVTFDSANRAHYFPVNIPTTCVARRLWWINGDTVSASYNVDVGIYRDGGYKPGSLLISTGSTAQGTASQVQFVDITDTTLPPGRYWLAIACSSTSATFFRISMNTTNDAIAKFMQTSALPLPATATPAETSNASIYIFGFATTSSP